MVTAVLGLMRTDLEMVYGEFSYDESLDGGSDDVRRIGNGRLIDNIYHITGNNDEEERIEIIRSRLAGQLDTFEKELGEMQEVISNLVSDAQESIPS